VEASTDSAQRNRPNAAKSVTTLNEFRENDILSPSKAVVPLNVNKNPKHGVELMIDNKHAVILHITYYEPFE